MPDLAEYRRRRFPNKGLARAFAVRTAHRAELPYQVAYVREYREHDRDTATARARHYDIWREGDRWFEWLGEAEEYDHTD